MGYYINPPNQTKEQFLAEKAMQISKDEFATFEFKRDLVPLCWMDNGAFSALGIAYNQSEIRAFAAPDRRIKKFYVVPLETLKDPMTGIDNLESLLFKLGR